jgi:hypothetical protein
MLNLRRAVRTGGADNSREINPIGPEFTELTSWRQKVNYNLRQFSGAAASS